MGFSISVLNNIRANASQDYQTRIPEATRENIITIGNAFSTYTELFNEFSTALLCKIGKTQLEGTLFKNKLAKYKSGTILNQQDVEEIFMGQIKAEGAFDPEGKNPLGRRETAQDKVVYHRQNRQDYYVISLGDLDFLRVFRSEATLDDYITRKLNEVFSAAEKDEWVIMKNLLATFDGYCDYEVPVITEATAEASTKRFLKTLRKAVMDVQFLSTNYNKAKVETKTEPGNLVLLINKDVLAEVDVEVLAKAFNMGKTDIQVQIETMDDFGELTDTYGLLVDKDWFRIWDTLSRMEPQRNAQGLFTNYFYHVHQIVSCSPFKTAIRFKAVSGS